MKPKKKLEVKLTPKVRTKKQIEDRKKAPNRVKRAESRAKDRANRDAAIKADEEKMKAKMEAPIPETSADPLEQALVPGAFTVQTTQL